MDLEASAACRAGLGIMAALASRFALLVATGALPDRLTGRPTGRGADAEPHASQGSVVFARHAAAWRASVGGPRDPAAGGSRCTPTAGGGGSMSVEPVVVPAHHGPARLSS
jgi:hypothetical protein